MPFSGTEPHDLRNFVGDAAGSMPVLIRQNNPTSQPNLPLTQMPRACIHDRFISLVPGLVRVQYAHLFPISFDRVFFFFPLRYHPPPKTKQGPFGPCFPFSKAKYAAQTISDEAKSGSALLLIQLTGARTHRPASRGARDRRCRRAWWPSC